MQKYKVFINNKAIFIVDNINNIEITDNDIIYKYENYQELYTIIDDFRLNRQKDILYVYHKDIKTIYKGLFSALKIIRAAGGLVKNEDSEILMIFRFNKWDLPKGKIDKNESKKSAAVREVIEECGISDVKLIRYLEAYYHIYLIGERLVLKKTYWYEMFCNDWQNIKPQTEENITDLKWMNEVEIVQALENTYQNIFYLINNYLKK